MRHFKDWLTAYREYAKDDFCPEKFHLWAGIFTISAALERKVWFEQLKLYPNVYVFLIARPGLGKSTAGSIGVELLRMLEGPAGKLKALAMQSSEASFLNQMVIDKKFLVDEVEYRHASAYLYASEAANSLKEMVGGGSVIGALTELYDCPPLWEKKLVKTGDTIVNACCNLLACCTFSHINKIIPRSEIDGGFASRILYVAHPRKEEFIRTPKLGQQGRNPQVKQKLLEDLIEIYHLTGPRFPDAEFVTAYETWYPENDKAVHAMSSERMQSFMARKHTNLLKLSMICAASESNSKTLTLRHWERAHELMSEVEKHLPEVLDCTLDVSTQGGMNYTILKTLEDAGGALAKKALNQHMMRKGHDMKMYEEALRRFTDDGLVRIEIVDTAVRFKLATDPKQYL